MRINSNYPSNPIEWNSPIQNNWKTHTFSINEITVQLDLPGEIQTASKDQLFFASGSEGAVQYSFCAGNIFKLDEAVTLFQVLAGLNGDSLTKIERLIEEGRSVVNVEGQNDEEMFKATFIETGGNVYYLETRTSEGPKTIGGHSDFINSFKIV